MYIVKEFLILEIEKFFLFNFEFETVFYTPLG